MGATFSVLTSAGAAIKASRSRIEFLVQVQAKELGCVFEGDRLFEQIAQTGNPLMNDDFGEQVGSSAAAIKPATWLRIPVISRRT